MKDKNGNELKAGDRVKATRRGQNMGMGEINLITSREEGARIIFDKRWPSSELKMIGWFRPEELELVTP